MRYKIAVRTIQGTILTFSTDKYEVVDGFVTWLDIRTNSIKRFAVPNCEIQEIMDAYIDCNRKDQENGHIQRNLSFMASQEVTTKEAYEILKEAIPDGYNEFDYKLLLLFPDDCKIRIARSGSVALYIKKGEKKLPTKKELNADAYHTGKDGYIVIWWD